MSALRQQNDDSHSVEHARFSPRRIHVLDDFDPSRPEYANPRRLERDLHKIGIGFKDPSLLRKMARKYGYAMDAIQSTITTPSMAVPVQFLQFWMPGLVQITTAERLIDTLVGYSAMGSWETEEIVQTIIELTGSAVPYGDTTNTTYANFNMEFARRTNVRFELGMRVGPLEEKRVATVNVNSAASKRNAIADALEIIRNAIGFYGYNNGANRTYGFLTDPNEPAYVAVPDGASGDTFWSKKTYLEIVADIRGMLNSLRTQSKERVNPRTSKITLALATSVIEYMSVTSDFGNSVEEWLTDNYKNVRVVSAPELDAANGGENVAYMYAEEVMDGQSTDDRRTFVHMVSMKFFLLGVIQLIKGFKESYTNGTAGVMCKRPYAMVRRTGL